MRAILRRAVESAGPHRGAGTSSRARARRVAAALVLAMGFGAFDAAQAGAFTLRLVLPDGQPMTYGSACLGIGCLQRGDRVQRTDANGDILLSGISRTVEYRRDGILLGLLPAGVASGTIFALGDRATVVLPRILVGTDPAIDPAESDLVARLNEARAARGLALAQINPKLATAADAQATWLTQSGVTIFGDLHSGPFQSDMAFRKGEVSLPDPATGGEIAEAGGTVEQAVDDWMSSPEHREQILAPGKLLIGAGKVGTFIIVDTHRPCDGCVQSGSGSRLSATPAPAPAPPAPLAPPVAVAAGSPAPAPIGGSSLVAAAPQPACGREQLSTRRLQSIGGRVRLRVSTRCLRRGARYVLLVRQGTTGKLLRTVRIARAGTITLALRPARTANRLRIKLKRNGTVVVSRTMSLRM